MIDARNYQEKETLRNGVTVTVRTIRPGDKELILEGVNECDQQSLYMRFFRYKREFTNQEINYLTDVDFVDHVALVVSTSIDGSDKIIGGGRYFAFDNPTGVRTAEIAFLVHDQYQGQGIGSLMMKHLLIIARSNGIVQFEAEVLADNSKMLAVFSRIGLPMKTVRIEDVLHVSISLAPVTTLPA